MTSGLRTPKRDLTAVEGLIFSLDQTAIHDGPGARMNVYLKGCPLRCTWCHSPESQSSRPEIVWFETRCAGCGRCVEVCSEGVRTLELMDPAARTRCDLCETCVRACANAALEVRGRTVTAGEVFTEAMRLQPFFRRTGGGITLTGGEPTIQPEFCLAIARLCHEAGIHVAVETCGIAPWSVLRRLARVVDLFLFDFKHPDGDMHRAHTGVSNRRIQQNLGRLARNGAEVTARVPLIPGVNDDLVTVQSIGRRLVELDVRQVTLLPFNPAMAGKYSWIQREPPPPFGVRQSREQVAVLQDALAGQGLIVLPA